MSAFFDELKRRKVYRVAVAYVVVAGGMIQLASAAFPAWELPNWALRLVIVLLLIGFPIALILAWAFDVTPQGIRSTPPAETSRPTHRRRNLTVLCFTGLLVSAIAGFFLLPRASANKLEKSIAVLPFENFSADKENAYFADGIQDDVLTSLSKVGDLKVISRTSVMAYRGSTRNIREIGKALGVGAILEGSVRKSGNRVRVNVQLINAANDEHIWAEDYDRDLTDVFAIQSDLAHEITTALRAKLSPQEKAMMERKPTENAEAYALYLQAHAYEAEPDETTAGRQKCEQQLERAVQLDPSFALAYATLSRLESHIYHEFEPVPARIEKARAAAAHAIRLQPDLPEAHVALGNVYYYGDRDYERALAEYNIAWRGLPNDPLIYGSIGAIKRRQGKWDEAIANQKRQAELDPNRAANWSELSFTYRAVRDFSNAIKAADRAIVAAPHSYHTAAARASIDLEWHGDIEPLERVVANASGPDPEGRIASDRTYVKYLQRKYDEAAQALLDSPRDVFEGEGGVPVPKSFLLGVTYWAAHDASKARANLQSSLGAMEEVVRASPQSAVHHIAIGQAYALLGRSDEAVREGRRAVELLPESLDALNGPDVTIGLAEIYAMMGDADAALPLIEHSLSAKVGMTVHRLRLDAFWDPIRNDPRFRALIEKYNAKT